MFTATAVAWVTMIFMSQIVVVSSEKCHNGVEQAGCCGSHALLSTQEMIKKSPRDDRDAEILALRAGKQLVASDTDYQRFAADLKAIRGDYQCEVCAAPDKGTDTMMLSFGESSEEFDKAVAGEHKSLDCLNAWYGGRIEDVWEDARSVFVKFDHIFYSDLIFGA